jgi:hypothetical protein
MSKRPNQSGSQTTTTTTVTTEGSAPSTQVEQIARMRTGKTVADNTEVGPAAGMAASTLAELEQIQASILAKYGMKEATASKVVGRLKDLDE